MYENNLEKATFAAGCFWGVEEAFLKMKGVKSTRVGYTGGIFPDPSCEDVCTDKTGHTEAIELEFDPNEISYKELLNFFWSIHNPTTKNRQGLDIGSQFSSTIFYHDPEQEKIARKSKQELDDSNSFQNKIITEIVPAATFYQAEDYHQKYYQKIGGASCFH